MQNNILIAIVAGLIGGAIGAGVMYQSLKQPAQTDSVTFKIQVPKGLMDEDKK
jgi:hypothetical protein